MSKLDDCKQRVDECSARLDQVNAAYRYARQLLQAADPSAEPGGASPLSDCGLLMTFAGTDIQVPVPVPVEGEAARSMLEEGMSFLGQEIVRLWVELAEAANEARQHCEEAAARAEGGS